MLRSPVVCILAHVDHGKTSILDYIRGSAIAKKEAGGITQMIGAYYLPKQTIVQVCGPLAKTADESLKVPGLLFIDTPGHEAFTSMRERGGSIADMAILVIDIMQGIQPQTVESLKILRANKTPFIIALNKIDLLDGWKAQDTPSFAQSIKTQSERVQTMLDEKLYNVLGKLSQIGYESERYDRVSDFTKQITIVPCSAKTGEGIAELLLYLAGLCQKFLSTSLEAQESSPAKGSILEVKDEKGLGTTIDVIIYDGTISKNDFVAFGTTDGAKVVKIRGLLRPPLPGENSGTSKYMYVEQIHAAAGIKIYAPGIEHALAGSPLLVVSSNKVGIEIEQEITQQVNSILVHNPNLAGVIVKTDTLGSAEAFMRILRAANVPVKEISIGPVSKKDVVSAHTSSMENKYVGAVLAFNVPVNADALEESVNGQIPIISSKVIYTILDDFLKWAAFEKDKDTSEIMCATTSPAKIVSLPNCFFHLVSPAIFGVEILSGTLKPRSPLMDVRGEIIGQVKAIQLDAKNVESAKKGDKVAISVEGPYCGKTFKAGDEFYTFLNREQARILKEKCSSVLNEEDMGLIEEIVKINMAKMMG